MKYKRTLRFIFLLSYLAISLITCNQTIQDTINLQQNERYVLKLDDYYDFTASQIDFPKNQPEENIKVPYKEIGSQNEDSNIFSITSYQDGLSSKYLIGYSKVRNEVNNNFDIQINYFHLELIYGVLTKTQLASQTLFSSSDTNFQIQASFYCSTHGFVSYKSDLTQGTSHFSYIENKGLITISIKNIQYIDQHVAMKGNGDNIYIIYANDTAVNLLKYQTGLYTTQVIDAKDYPTIIRNNIVIDITNSFIGYDILKNILYSYFIDFTTEKLIVNRLTLPELDSLYKVLSLQRFKDILILTLIDFSSKKGSVYINLNDNKFIGKKNNISINNIIKTRLYFRSIPIFIDQNILVFYYSNSLQMINIKTQKLIFQKKLDNNYSFDPNQYIGNQFIISITKKDDEGKIKHFSQTALIQNPSQVIIGTNQLLEYTVYKNDQPVSLKIQIKINVTDDLITKFTKDLINLQLMTPLSYQDQQIPVEKFIIGSNFNPEITVSENGFDLSAQLHRLYRVSKTKYQSPVYIKNIQNTYQTDGLISTFMICQNDTDYFISAATPKLDGEDGEVILYFSNSYSQPPIRQIDNYGSFILQSDVGTNSFTINVPFIVSNQKSSKHLDYRSFKTTCSKANFTFASDPYSNILFILCDKSILQINYQYNNAVEGQLFVVSQNNLIFDASQYQKLICIKGNLFIYNDQFITAYNYQVNSFIGNPIQIPQLQDYQEIILFSQSFIISYKYQERLNIQLFSYDQFQNQERKAVFVRYLLLDQPSEEFLSLIPKRNQIEYLYVSNKDQNQYQLFRINNAYSQNQFYTNVSMETDSPNVRVISQDGICLISSKQDKCYKIFEQATLIYSYGGSRDFNSLLSFQSLITLKIGDQQQTYDLNILRNASTQYGIIQTYSFSIYKLMSDLLDGNFVDGTIFYFDDQNLLNACILGWESVSSNALIINRIENVDTQITSYVFTILYNQKAVLESNQIKIGNNLLAIQGDFSYNCYTILDDSASKVQINPTSFIQDIYLICETRLYKFTVKFTSDKTGIISQATLLDQNSQSFDASGQEVYFRRIVSIDTELWLFDPTKQHKYQIKKKEDEEQLSVSFQQISLTSILSFNVISSLNLKLSFFRSGLINVQNVENSKDIQYSYFYLQDLLKSNSFIVDQNDQIASIYQYSDTKFRIQYTQSFIYDITFSLDKNQQLIIESVSLYYYKDAFDIFYAGITGDQYTLLFGEQQGNIMVVIYNNQSIIQHQYLIQSAQKINQKAVIQDSATITYAEQINQNQFVIYYSNGSSTSITISDRIGMKIFNQQLHQGQVVIHPKLLTDEQYQIKFYYLHPPSLPPSPSPSPSPSLSSQVIIWFSLAILFLLSLLLL